MHTPPAAPAIRTDDPWHALVRLAVVAWRRTAVDDSGSLLAAVVAVALLIDGALRVRTADALDRWLVAATIIAAVLPVALARQDPLRSLRLAMLPIPGSQRHRARVIASAPLRWPLAMLMPIVGSVPALRVASSAAVLTLVGWAVASFFAGAALDARWHRPRAIATRAMAAVSGALGAWCLWSLRGATPSIGESTLAAWIPQMLPRGGSAAEWLVACAVLASSAAVGTLVLRAPRVQVSDAARLTMPVEAQHAISWWRISLFDRRSFPRAVRPAVAHELALLLRHVGSRAALIMVAALACAATYGRVPGLALIAATPVMLLSANLLGADVALGGLVRHRLQPVTLTAMRDRRLSAWSSVAAMAAALGAIAGLVLPTPTSAGTPTGGVLAAPVMLLYAVTLIPWFGRAHWWWARRYPQPMARRLSEMGATIAAGPAGPAHLAIGLGACWMLVALVATLLWGAGQAAVRAVVLAIDPTLAAVDRISFLAGTLLVAGVALALHLAVGSRARTAMSTRWPASSIAGGEEAGR